MKKKIDLIKERMSSGKSRFENGKVLVEVSLSDLNELLDLAYKVTYIDTAIYEINQLQNKIEPSRNSNIERHFENIKCLLNGAC